MHISGVISVLLLAKYGQVDSPPSGILDEYADDDYYVNDEKSKKKSKGGKIKSPPSGGDKDNNNRRKKKGSARVLMGMKSDESNT